MIPIINNKYVPALYRIIFDDYLLLAVNSEITLANCKGWFNKTFNDNDNLDSNGNPKKGAINIYTGWEIKESSGTP